MGKKQKKSGRQKGAEAEVRLDKWLKVARIFKTRTLAQEAIAAGHVKSGTHAVKQGRSVRVGDEFSVTRGRRRLRFRVLVVTSRSVSAKDSHDLYEVLEDHTEKPPNRDFDRILDQIEDSRRHRGRPTKRERRQIDRFIRKKEE